MMENKKLPAQKAGGLYKDKSRNNGMPL